LHFAFCILHFKKSVMQNDKSTTLYRKRAKWLFLTVILSVFAILAFLISIYLVNYTNNNVYYVLNVPIVSYDVNTNQVEWQPVERAMGYQIKLDGREIGYFSNTTLSYNADKLLNGTHKFTIQAVGIKNIINSDWTNDYYFDVRNNIENILDTPTNLNVVDEILSWDHVPNATSYLIKIDGYNTISSDTNSVNIGYLKAGTYDFYVKAIA